MRKKRPLWLLATVIAMLLSSPALFAQNKTISGFVSDQNGAAVGNATVTVKNGKAATTTDQNGAFKINVPESAKALVITYVGAKPVEVSITDKSNVIATIEIKETKLNEVVVIGYGTARRAAVSTAISSVKAKDLKDLPVTGIDQALQGKVAGVTVQNNSGQPGGGVNLKVRGVTTINSNDPLIVVDGVVFESNTKSSLGFAGIGGANGQTGNSFLATINPNDIESIDILKDASAQAIYGSRAANGVILITTKKGKAGDGKIGYDFSQGSQEIYRFLPMMNLQQFAQYQNDVIGVVGLPKNPLFADPTKLGTGTDWQDAIFRRGSITSHNLSFSGGKDKTTYYISAGYFNQKGILTGSDFKRYTARVSFESQLKSWIKTGFSVNGSRSTQNITLSDDPNSIIWNGLLQNPLIPIKNPDGTFTGSGFQSGGLTYYVDNPVARSFYTGNQSISSYVFGNVFADAEIIKGLSFRNEFGYSMSNYNNSGYSKSGLIGNTPIASQLIDYRGNGYFWSFKSYFSYYKTIGNHSFNATAGHEAQVNYWEQLSGTKTNLQNNILDLNAGSSDKLTWGLNGGKNDASLESYFARVNYTYDNRYTVGVSLRRDASSKFYGDYKWGTFPGASVGWTVTNEKFAEKMKKVVDYLKVRVSYGAVGNQNMPNGAPNPPYTSVVSFWPGPVGFGTSNYLYGVANPNLKWESVVTQDVGFDAAFLDNRVEVSFDYYKKTTKDMLIIGTGPRLIGVGDQWDDLKGPVINVGQMTNTGFDFSVNTTNVKSKSFTWKSNIIFTRYKNILDKLAGSTAALTGKLGFAGTVVTFTQPGYPVGSFFGYQTDGLFRTADDLAKGLPQFGQAYGLGDVRFKDVSGPNGKPDGIIDANDITFIGSPLPKFTYGFTNTFNYKNFDASVFLQGSYGSKIFNYTKTAIESQNSAFLNQLTSVMDRYTETNTNGSLPRFTIDNPNNNAISDRYVEDGSYMRIQNITLGYRVPAKVLQRIKFNTVRVYFTVQNVHTFTKYSGFDPEIGAFNNDIRLMNVDAGHYPTPRTFSFGANIEL